LIQIRFRNRSFKERKEQISRGFNMERLRRSMFFTPGGNEKMMSKALLSEADSIIIDLEDSVAPQSKKEAREYVKEFIQRSDFRDKEVVVRVNSLKTEYGREDFESIIQAQPHSMVIPKSESGLEMKELDNFMGDLEKRYNLPVREIGIIPLIETPAGVINVDEIAMSTPRVSGVLFGAGDFIRETRGEITKERLELYFPLMKIVIAARAAKIDAIDTPYFDVRDSEGCEANARQAKLMGYDGKAAIHPFQVDVINKVFTPTSEEVQRAKKVIEVYQRAEAEGKGAVQIDGQLIEHVHVTIAKRVLGIAERAGVQ
jgi:citrate lyase subunit beta/citryl-CoA lyase